MPTLPCPHCSHLLEVAVSRAGAEVECPACHRPVTVPTLGQLRQLEDPRGQPPPAAGPSGTAMGRRIAFAGLLGIAAIALIIASFGFIRYAAIPPPQTTAEHIAETERIYSEVPAAQLVREWQLMEDFNPELAAPHRYKLIADEKAAWLRQGLIGLAVAGCAVLLAALLMLWKPRAN